MLNLFKRSKIEKWEIDLLTNIFSRIKETHVYLNQIKDGLLRNILLDASDIPGYNSFGLNHNIFKKYETNERSFKFSNIKVYDLTTKSYLKFNIYISSGVITGYSIENLKKKFKLEVTNIDVSQVKKIYLENPDYDRISHLFNEEEKSLLDLSEVYSLIVDKKEYFHIKDLEDGDFLGIDNEKNVYSIKHNPMSIIRIEKSIKDILSK